MSIVVKLAFPAGRYHATPWGRHVNEGVAEWPPSPWRLLRSLVAVWKRTCPELAESDVRRVLEYLLSPPQFYLPKHRTAHTRHYMPWEKKGPADRTLVFDTFVTIDRSEAVYVKWSEAVPTPEHRELLQRLLNNLSSLGRAESWVQAELAEEADVTGEQCHVATEDTTDPVSLLCPDPATAFAANHYPMLDAKKLAQGKINPSEFLFDCPRWHLCLDTETIHAKRWPTVPGSRSVSFTRPTGRSERIARKRSKSGSFPPPTIARFMLDAPVLPLTTDTVRVAEAFRHAVMGCFNRWCKKNVQQAGEFRRPDDSGDYSSPTLSGRYLSGEIRKDHKHAYYLSTADGKSDSNHLRFVTIYAKEGFGPCETAALTAMRELSCDRGRLKARVQLVGLGAPENFSEPLFAPDKATVWESITPYVVHRHFKRNGTKRDPPPADGEDLRTAFLKLSAGELVEKHYGDACAKIEVLPDSTSSPRSIDFRRFRDDRRDEAQGRWFGRLRIQFSRPMSGPIVLGYASHFGLGLFDAIAD